MTATFTNLAKSNVFTFTVTIASPAIFSRVSHGLTAGSKLFFETTGLLPTGLTTGTTYYVISAGLTANSFEVAVSSGGSAVNTSGSQSGTHSAFKLNFSNMAKS
jgi:hypothetical protein